ncbi:MAG: hypothetical protein WBE13_18880 [Candidatus Acidiferrum sp.]
MANPAIVILVVEDNEFLKRSHHGAIWGTVYFQIGESLTFPCAGWTDLVAAFVVAWLDGLLRVAEGTPAWNRIPFFDGPCAIEITTLQNGLVELRFFHEDKVQASATVALRDLLANARSVAKGLLSKCQQEGWSNIDTETLANLIFSREVN